MKNKKVLVTGGAGFIGSNMCQMLSEYNEIVIYDNFYTGKYDNIKELADMDNVELINNSILDYDSLNSSFDEVDYVFHLASITSVPLSVEMPNFTNEVNVKGYLNVLDLALKNNVKKVTFASSAAVYGNNENLPLREEYAPSPLSPYALTKLICESYTQLYEKTYGLKTISLRYFNVYGPRQDPNSQYASVIPTFIKSIHANESPIIYGDGEQTRDFIYVNDVVKANIKAAESNATGVYNVASGAETSINTLAKLLLDYLDSDLDIIYLDKRNGDIKYSFADVSRAKRELAFKTEYDMEKGLELTYEWYKDNKNLETMQSSECIHPTHKTR